MKMKFKWYNGETKNSSSDAIAYSEAKHMQPCP